LHFKQARSNIIYVNKSANFFILGGTSTLDPTEAHGFVQGVIFSNGGSNIFQVPWIKNIAIFRSSLSSHDASTIYQFQDHVSKESSGSSQRGYSIVDSV